MAKALYCRDVGTDCDFVARGESVDEVLAKVKEHGEKNHGMTEIGPDMVEKIKGAIKEE